MSESEVIFPDPRQATEEGIVALGGRMDVATLKAAYRQGIFPWPQPGYPLIWCSPDPRGVIDFSELHIPKSLARSARRSLGRWTFTVNQAFTQVMQECQKKPRPGQTGTWILDSMIPAYQRLRAEDLAMSLECWNGQELVAGIYGVSIAGYFSGESMFTHEPDASKLCLVRLIDVLKSRGHSWIDVQMVTPVIESLGGKYISREEFLQRIGVFSGHGSKAKS